MAQAMVRFWAAWGKGGQGRQSTQFYVYFWGDDVPAALDGQPQSVDVYMPPSWSITALNQTLTAAIIAKAASLGLSVTAANVYVDTYEAGTASGILVWLDAQTLTGYANNDPVSSWTDLSGNGYHATQGTAAAKPLYKSAGINGHPSIRYDGSDDELIVSLAVAQPCTVLLVMKHLTGSVAANQSLVVGYDAPYAGLICKDATPDVFGLNGASGGLTGASLDANPHVIAGVFNGASSVLTVDGVVSTGNIGTGNLANTIDVGGGGPPCLNGDLGEVMMFNTALAAADRHSYELSLGAKWGIPVS